MQITRQYLIEHPDHIFVFGDNELRAGEGGAAALRDMPNTYGFIAKKCPCNNDNCFYMPDEYEAIYHEEVSVLALYIVTSPGKTFLISKLGAGLANRFGIFEAIIRPRIKYDLQGLGDVQFLW